MSAVSAWEAATQSALGTRRLPGSQDADCAQALVEGLTLVTRDRQFELYRVPVLWV